MSEYSHHCPECSKKDKRVLLLKTCTPKMLHCMVCGGDFKIGGEVKKP